MRTAFIQELAILARTHPRIFLLVGDLGYSVVEPFAQEFPDRYLNMGIAEQNMTGVAAGLASEGYHVFTYSIANFPTFRCAEQIRNDVVYHRLPVTIVSVGGGLAYGNLGYSHHAVQDIALMRTFPGMTLACPGDPVETRACLRCLTARPVPSYLRLGKAGEPTVHAAKVDAVPGRILQTETNGSAKPNALLTTGATLRLAQELAASPDFSGSWGAFSLPIWNEGSKSAVQEFVASHNHVVVLEDHLRAGGFGSFVQEALDARPDLLARVRCVALDGRVCGHVASQSKLNEMGGVSFASVAAVLSELSQSRSKP